MNNAAKKEKTIKNVSEINSTFCAIDFCPQDDSFDINDSI